MYRSKATQISAIIILLSVSSFSYARIYKCTTENGIVFSDISCPNAKNNQVERLNLGPSSLRSKQSGRKGRERKVLTLTATDELIQSCLDKWRPLLKDPRSPYVVSSQIDEVRNLERPDREPWKELVLNVRAKNSFGAFIPETFFCGVGEDGLVDEKITEVNQAMFSLGLKYGFGDKYVK